LRCLERSASKMFQGLDRQMTDHHDDHFDGGFTEDLPRLIGRRRLLSLMGGLGVLSLSGVPALALECVALPWETAGPYPADGSNVKAGQVVNALTQEGVIRTDLRTSFGGMTPVADGLQLDLELTLVDADGCTPLVDHAIYIWHCDATGLYSLYDTTDRNYLRGVGISDGDGKVRFTTIMPGCYDGRWPHIHFEVFSSAAAAVSGEASVLTAQIAMPEAEAAALYAADARYSNGTTNLGRISIATDNVFRDNSAEAIAQQTLAITGDPLTGYAGTLTIPVDFTAERSTQMAPPADGAGPGGQPPGPPPS
jgi:protocatechuate 3,4-dioxygenase beta subunit